ncbi:hypothetical protein PF008_g13462 [Phytophthora fragariae]|uniref:Uncharacterized protein n=1 Tax=Phytophthora fragariae TaxID=53985 RepID=A0A6G0RLA3_9STRA|nr:hypothetical protein PF008_g13462 [Phytophthora fragariae]
MSASYFYLRPGVFGVVGFAYGTAEGSGARGGKVKVKLVTSGRWSEEQGQSVELTGDEVAARTVTTEEALNGAGTFVGGVICTSRVRPGGARVWDYGLVTGYTWCTQEMRGLLDMNFGGTAATVVYTPDSTQDVAVEIYALQHCGGLSTSLVMASEMKKQHETIYNKFNGMDCPATRDSKLLLAHLARKPVDEARLIPLLDITSFEVTQVAVRHILDYVFFKEGGRTCDEVELGDCTQRVFDIFG